MPRQLPLYVAACFPFTSQARAYAADTGISVEKLLTDWRAKRIKRKGLELCIASLQEDVQRTDDRCPCNELSEREECMSEIYSFAVARMIIAVIGDPMLTNRFAISVSKQAASWLEGIMRDYLMDIASGIGIAAVEQDNVFSLHFTDFLRYTSRLRSPDWKLVNQKVRKGYVLLERGRFIRVVQQAIADHLQRNPPYDEEIKEKLRGEIQTVVEELTELKKKYQHDVIGVVKKELFPPCMKEILRQIQASENVPHMGRFAIVTFLHAIGMSADEIFDAFGTVPDFSAEKTRYQIEHITGAISSTEYSVPECSTMKSYGICFNPDELCSKEWMKHPMIYYRTKLRSGASSRQQQRDKVQ